MVVTNTNNVSMEESLKNVNNTVHVINYNDYSIREIICLLQNLSRDLSLDTS
jgi:hypothetical protein